MKIVFLSHTIRSSIFKVGSYFLSKQLAEQGHEVLYISSPLSFLHIFTFFIGRKIPDFFIRWKYRIIQKDEEGVMNHVPIQLIPFTNKLFFNSYSIYKKFSLNLSKSNRQIKELGFSNPDLVIQDSLKLNFCGKYFKPKKWVYRVTDLYSDMPDAPHDIDVAEREAVNKSDHIIATSEPLKEILKKTYGTDVTVLRNGVDFSNFDKIHDIPKEYEGLKGDICIYVGSMDDRFDHNLIKFLAEDASLNIILIGPVEKEIYSALKNVICLGEISNNNISPYLKHADVGLLPFKIVAANHNRSPMKIYEYGASGLPVVSTKLKEIERRKSKFVFIANDYEDFRSKIKECIKNKKHIFKIAKTESKNYSWESITSELMEIVRQN